MTTLHIVCPHCQAVNRTAAERLSQHPRCGQCIEAVFTGRDFQQHITRNDLPVVVDCQKAWKICQLNQKKAPKISTNYRYLIV